MDITKEKNSPSPAATNTPLNQYDKLGQLDTQAPKPPANFTKPFRFFVFGLIFIILLFGAIIITNNQPQLVTSYTDCVKAKGSIVTESYPATCITKDKQRFVQDLTDEEKKNLIPPIATEGLQNYINSKFGFQIKIPLVFFYKEIGDNSVNFIENQYKNKEYNYPFLGITVYETTKSAVDFVNENGTETPPIGVPQDTKEYIWRGITTTKTAEFNSLDVLQFTSETDTTGTDHTLFKKDAIIVDVFNRHMGVTNVSEEIYKQILSTFEFIDNDEDLGIPSNNSNAKEGCQISGCSNEICQNADSEPAVSICLYSEKFVCYKDAVCEKQPDGNCDWTSTDELTFCLSNFE